MHPLQPAYADGLGEDKIIQATISRQRCKNLTGAWIYIEQETPGAIALTAFDHGPRSQNHDSRDLRKTRYKTDRPLAHHFTNGNDVVRT